MALFRIVWEYTALVMMIFTSPYRLGEYHHDACSIFSYNPQCHPILYNSLTVFVLVMGSQLGAFCPYAIVYCNLEFRLSYNNDLKLFSIRVKESFEPIVLREKTKQQQQQQKKRQVFAIFKSIFLRNRSLSDARWFNGKKCKIGKGNLCLTENWFRRTKCGMLQIITIIIYVSHAKKFLNSILNEAVIDKISNFHKTAQISHIHKNHYFWSIMQIFGPTASSI